MAKKNSAISALAGLTTKQEPTKSKTDKETIKVSGQVAKAIDKYVEASMKIDAIAVEMKAAESVIKEHGAELAVETLTKSNAFESFIMASETNGLLFICQDKPKVIKDDRLAQVEEIVGEDNVVAKTKLILNPEIFEKHSAAIAKALRGMKIPDEDKALLIKEETNYEYTFKLKDMARIAGEQKTTVAAVFQTYGPTLQLKGRPDAEKSNKK